MVKVTNPPNVNLSQVVIDAGLNLSGGDYDITMKAARTVDGKDISALAAGFPKYGDGSDGDVTSSGDIDLGDIKVYNNLTIQNGHTLTTTTKKYIVIFVKETLTVNAGGEITVKGIGKAGGAHEVQGTAGIGGGSGGAGGAKGTAGNPGSNGVSPRAGGGGGANASFAGDSDGAAGIDEASSYSIINIMDWLTHVKAADEFGSGGSGGGDGRPDGGGSNGGAGGAAGGIIIIFAREIINNGSINANGADGVNGQNGNTNGGGGGGGGGGDGGLLYIITSTFSGNAATASGGAGGAGGGSGAGGRDGGDGAAGAAGNTQIMKP